MSASAVAPVFVLLLLLQKVPIAPAAGDLADLDRSNLGFHTMISTDCSVYSDWQSEVLAYTHYKSGSTGKLTRIASCQDPGYSYPKIWHPEMLLETTPYFGKQELANGTVDKYPIYNKPFGINHWLTRGGGAALPDSTVVAMLDPDMIIQMPLQHAFESNLTGEPVVSAGRPAAHRWPLGSNWYTKWGAEQWLEEECAMDPPSCRRADRGPGVINKHYQVGAPQAMTAGDWRALCPLWGRYLLRIRQEQKGWMSDMNAFILAAMHLGLRHQVTTSLQVWSTGAKTDEAWHLLHGLDRPRSPGQSNAPKAEGRFEPRFAYDGETVPILHYCRTAELRGRTDIGSHDRFSKYGFKKQPAGAADCSPQPTYRYNNQRLLEVQNDPGEALEARRHAFLMRTVASAVWEALAHYRTRVCGGEVAPPAAGPRRQRRGPVGARRRHAVAAAERIARQQELPLPDQSLTSRSGANQALLKKIRQLG